MSPPSSQPGETEAPRVLEQLVRRAEAARASDVHLQMVGRKAQVCFRLDGVLTAAWELAEPVAERVVGRIKYLARLKTYQESLPQDGRIDRGEVGAQSDLRVATYPTVTGEKVVLRLFQSGAVLALDELGFSEDLRGELGRFLEGSTGLLLLTGPAGSGKTTTIYACLRHLAGAGGRHIITVEDPVEQVISGIMQTEVSEARGLDFACAARHLMRQDPQVLVLGEIRDEETARLALRAALTGHLVISTLHAGSCQGVYDRLLSMGLEPQLVATALEMVVNQRLVRRVCPACRGEGCDGCVHTGYRGRVPVAEFVRVAGVRAELFRGGSSLLIPTEPLAAAAQRLCVAGVTNAAEVGRILRA